MRSTIIIAFLFAGLGLAEADIVKLKNGSKLEGTVLDQDQRRLVLKVKGGGKMTLPMSNVAHVLSKASSEAAYAERVLDVDFDDPRDIERLSLWASQQGMGEKAMDLMDMAQGLRLERMIARAKAQQRAQAFVDVFYWARGAGLDQTVQVWILDQGRALDPGDKSVANGYARIQKDNRQDAERRRRLAEIASRPRYKLPSNHLPPATVPSVAEMKARINRERSARRARRGVAAPERDRTWLQHARDLRVAEAKRTLKKKKKRKAAQPQPDPARILEAMETEWEVVDEVEVDSDD